MNTLSKNNPALISTFEQVLSVEKIKPRKTPDSILMCDPTYFDVIDVKNSFMKDNQAQVDKRLALSQWNALKDSLSKTAVNVEILPSAPNLEDMVFSANQVLVGVDEKQQNYIVPSSMKHESRNKEVPFYKDWFEKKGYKIIELESLSANDTNESGNKNHFEAHGDAIWHPEKMLLWGGYGHRTSKATYIELQKKLDIPIILLELVDSTFYHLDTCFCTLDKDTVMIYPKAFSEEGNKLIRHMFKNVLEVTSDEANNFACNALCIKDQVLIQKGNQKIVSALKEAGFKTIEVDTSEFMKSGGSVFCLTLDFYK